MGVILPNMIAEGFQFFSCNHIWNGPRNDTGCWILDTGCANSVFIFTEYPLSGRLDGIVSAHFGVNRYMEIM